VDLYFTGDGNNLKLDDYRLDDVPYPVSQLFTSFPDAKGSAGDVQATVTLAHRDLDGSVQYIAEVRNAGSRPTSDPSATFIPASGAGGSAGYRAIVFVDPIGPNASGNELVVLPGAFPGSAGTLRLGFAAATFGSVPPGSTPPTDVAVAVPDFPALTPRPVHTVQTSTTTSSSSSTTSSSTSSTSSSTTSTSSTSSTSSSTVPTTSTSSSVPPSSASGFSSTTTR
jgi:hypothetical protein